MEKKINSSTRNAKKGALSRLLLSIKNLVDPQLPLEDRREANRAPCSVRVEYLTESGLSANGQLLDISRRGLRMQTAVQLNKGLTLALKPPSILADNELAAVMAQVVWTSRKGEAFFSGLLLPPGIEDEATWLKALITHLGYSHRNDQRREFVRTNASIPGYIYLNNAEQLQVIIKNLSLGGALLNSKHEIAQGSSFSLQLGPLDDLPMLPLTGVILRSEGEHETGEYNHSSRFGPLEGRRHALLKEYILKLLKE